MPDSAIIVCRPVKPSAFIISCVILINIDGQKKTLVKFNDKIEELVL